MIQPNIFKILLVAIEGVSDYSSLISLTKAVYSFKQISVLKITHHYFETKEFAITKINYRCSFESKDNFPWSPFSTLCTTTLLDNNFPKLYSGRNLRINCPLNCEECDSSGYCTRCAENNYIVGGMCVQCNENCYGCSELSYFCDACYFNQKIDYVIMNDHLDLNICSNCHIEHCEVCFYNICLVCKKNYTRIESKCYDCSNVLNFELYFQKLGLRYKSLFVQKFSSQLIIDKNTGIISFVQVSCENADEPSKCENCLQNVSNKFDFVTCYFFHEKHIKKVKNQLYGRQISNKLVPNRFPRAKITKEPEQPAVINANAISNCLMESSSEPSCQLCNSGFYRNHSECLACSRNCLKCSDASNCQICSNQFFLESAESNQRSCKFKFKRESIDLTKCEEIEKKFPDSILAKSKKKAF